MPRSQDILKQYRQSIDSRQDPLKVLSGAEQRLGIPTLQQSIAGKRAAISNTENLIKSIAPSVTGRTSGSLVTEAQRTGLIAKERQPLGEQLSTQQSGLNVDLQNLGDLTGRANLETELAIQKEADKIKYLSDLYEKVYGKEEADKQFKELKRQFDINAQIARSKAGGGGGYLGGLGLGDGGTQTDSGLAKLSQRKGGGFNFTIDGQPVSAAVYADATGEKFTSLLKRMAKKGDAGAIRALRFVGDNYKYDPRKVATQDQLDLYNSLVWGTGLERSSLTDAPNIPAGLTPIKLQRMLDTGYSGFDLSKLFSIRTK